jgi:hypothetical protein
MHRELPQLLDRRLERQAVMKATRVGSPLGVQRRNLPGLAVFGGFALLAFLYLGVRLLVEPGAQYLGAGSDPLGFIWCFGWWPYAIAHGTNPFVTHAIWAPNGVNLIWTASVPGLALLFSPLTIVAGPVVSYNVATVLLPAFAAWTAFVLCRHLTGALWPSLVGGYLFGFSSYVLGEEIGHPHATAVFLVPLVALICTRFVEGELDSRGLVLRLGPLLGFEFLISTEVAFTLALALVSTVALGAVLLPLRRRRLVALLGPLVGAAAFAALLTAPFVYYAVTGFQRGAVTPVGFFTTDLYNFGIPTRNALVSLGWAAPIAHHFPGNDSERGAYLGVPALLIIAAYLWRRVRWATGRFLLASLTLAIICTLGSRLTIGGHATIWLPWSLVARWPLFDNVLPERLSVYVALLGAVIVALWIAAARHGVLRWLLPALAMLAIVPNPATGEWASGYTVPAFFTDGAYRSCLDPNENILPLPVTAGGESMLWQTVDGYRFRMAGGNIEPDPPRSFLAPTAIANIAWGASLTASQLPELESYIRAKQVTSVLVDPSMASQWSGALDRLATPQRLGGVVLYHISDGSPSCLGAA